MGRPTKLEVFGCFELYKDLIQRHECLGDPILDYNEAEGGWLLLRKDEPQVGITTYERSRRNNSEMIHSFTLATDVLWKINQAMDRQEEQQEA